MAADNFKQGLALERERNETSLCPLYQNSIGNRPDDNDDPDGRPKGGANDASVLTT